MVEFVFFLSLCSEMMFYVSHWPYTLFRIIDSFSRTVDSFLSKIDRGHTYFSYWHADFFVNS